MFVDKLEILKGYFIRNVRDKSRLHIPTIVFVIYSVIFIGCSDQQATDGGYKQPPTPVEIASVELKKVSDDFETVGTIEAIEAITIVSEISGSITKLPFKEGEKISKGELIAKIEDSQLKAEVLRAKALFQQYQSKYNRVEKIVNQNAGTPQDLDDALANLKVAEANLRLAEAKFEKTRITAPFSGIVGARKVSIGTFLRPGDAITDLANLKEIRVNFSTPERFLSKLNKGASITVSTPAYPEHKVNGKIIAIEPIIDSDTRSARIIAQLKNPGLNFRPGMSANISVTLSERPNALTIPSESIFANGNQSFVYVVNEDSTVKRTAVITGTYLSDVVEIVGGIEREMKVIKSGHQKLFDGAKVMPMNLQKQ